MILPVVMISIVLLTALKRGPSGRYGIPVITVSEGRPRASVWSRWLDSPAGTPPILWRLFLGRYSRVPAGVFGGGGTHWTDGKIEVKDGKINMNGSMVPESQLKQIYAQRVMWTAICITLLIFSWFGLLKFIPLLAGTIVKSWTGSGDIESYTKWSDFEDSDSTAQALPDAHINAIQDGGNKNQIRLQDGRYFMVIVENTSEDLEVYFNDRSPEDQYGVLPTLITVDSTKNWEQVTIAVDSNDNVYVAGFNTTDSRLAISVCTNATSGSPTFSSIVNIDDATPQIGPWSFVIAQDDFLHLAWQSSGDIHYMISDNASPTSFTGIADFESFSNSGVNASDSLGLTGNIHCDMAISISNVLIVYSDNSSVNSERKSISLAFSSSTPVTVIASGKGQVHIAQDINSLNGAVVTYRTLGDLPRAKLTSDFGSNWGSEEVLATGTRNLASMGHDGNEFLAAGDADGNSPRLFRRGTGTWSEITLTEINVGNTGRQTHIRYSAHNYHYPNKIDLLWNNNTLSQLEHKVLDFGPPDKYDTLLFSSGSTANATWTSISTGIIERIDTISGYTGTISIQRDLTIENTIQQAAGGFVVEDGNILTYNGVFSLIVQGTGFFILGSAVHTFTNTISIGAGGTFRMNALGGDVELIATEIINADTFEFTNNTTNTCIIHSNDTGTNVEWTGTEANWDSGGSGSKIQWGKGTFRGINFSVNTVSVTTGGGGVTIEMFVDVLFFDLIISSTDTVTANSTNIRCSGNFNISAGNFNRDASSLTMSGTSKILTVDGPGSQQSIRILIVTGTITVAVVTLDTLLISGGIQNSGTITIPSAKILESQGGAIPLFDNTSGTITGAGSLNFRLQSGPTQIIGTGGKFGTLTVGTVRFTGPGIVADHLIQFGGTLSTTGDIEVDDDNAINELVVDTQGNAVSCVNLTLVGNAPKLSAGTSTITCSGDVNFSAGSIFDRETSTIIMSGSAKSITTNGSTNNIFYNLTINGNTLHFGNVEVVNTFDNNAEFDTLTNVLTISNAAIPLFDNTTGTIVGSAGGELNFQISGSGATPRIVNSFGTIQHPLTVFRGTSSIDTNKFIQLGANFSTTGDVEIVSDHATFSMILDANTSDVGCADFTLVDTGGGGVTYDGGTGITTASGDIDLSDGTFIPGSSTLRMNGNGKKLTVASNSATLASFQAQNNVEIAGSGVTSVNFNDGATNALTVDATFTLSHSIDLRLFIRQIANFTNNNIIRSTTAGGEVEFNMFTSVAQTLDNIGTIKSNVQITSSNGGAVTSTLTLGDDLNIVADVAPGNLVVDTGVSDPVVLDADTFEINVAGTTTVSSSNGGATLTLGTSTLHDFDGDFTLTGILNGETSTWTCSANCDLSGGTYTQGVVRGLVMDSVGTTTLTIGANSRDFTALTFSGGQKFISASIVTDLVMTSGFKNTAVVTLSNVNLELEDTNAIQGFDNATGEINSGGSRIVKLRLSGDALWDDLGTLRQVSVTIQGESGVANECTLGENLTMLTSGILTIRNQGGTNTILDSDTFNIIVPQSATINTGATLKSAGNASGATWDIAGGITVNGTIDAGVSTSSVFTIDTGSNDIDLETGSTCKFFGVSAINVRLLVNAVNINGDVSGGLDWDAVTAISSSNLNAVIVIAVAQTDFSMDDVSVTNTGTSILSYGMDIKPTMANTTITNCTIRGGGNSVDVRVRVGLNGKVEMTECDVLTCNPDSITNMLALVGTTPFTSDKILKIWGSANLPTDVTQDVDGNGAGSPSAEDWILIPKNDDFTGNIDAVVTISSDHLFDAIQAENLTKLIIAGSGIGVRIDNFSTTLSNSFGIVDVQSTQLQWFPGQANSTLELLNDVEMTGGNFRLNPGGSNAVVKMTDGKSIKVVDTTGATSTLSLRGTLGAPLTFNPQDSPSAADRGIIIVEDGLDHSFQDVNFGILGTSSSAAMISFTGGTNGTINRASFAGTVAAVSVLDLINTGMSFRNSRISGDQTRSGLRLQSSSIGIKVRNVGVDNTDVGLTVLNFNGFISNCTFMNNLTCASITEDTPLGVIRGCAFMGASSTTFISVAANKTAVLAGCFFDEDESGSKISLGTGSQLISWLHNHTNNKKTFIGSNFVVTSSTESVVNFDNFNWFATFSDEWDINGDNEFESTGDVDVLKSIFIPVAPSTTYYLRYRGSATLVVDVNAYQVDQSSTPTTGDAADNGFTLSGDDFEATITVGSDASFLQWEVDASAAGEQFHNIQIRETDILGDILFNEDLLNNYGWDNGVDFREDTTTGGGILVFGPASQNIIFGDVDYDELDLRGTVKNLTSPGDFFGFIISWQSAIDYYYLKLENVATVSTVELIKVELGVESPLGSATTSDGSTLFDFSGSVDFLINWQQDEAMR